MPKTAKQARRQNAHDATEKGTQNLNATPLHMWNPRKKKTSRMMKKNIMRDPREGSVIGADGKDIIRTNVTRLRTSRGII